MANKYLDQSGVQYLWGKIKDKADATLLAAEKAAKEYVNGLLGMTDEDNKVVDKIKEVLDVFKNYEEEKNLVELLNNKLDKTDGGTITGNVTVSGSLTASGYFEASSGVTTDSIYGKTSNRAIFVEEAYDSTLGAKPLDVGDIESHMVRLQGPDRPVWRRLNTDGSKRLSNELVIDSDLDNYLSLTDGGIVKGNVEFRGVSIDLTHDSTFSVNNINLVDGQISLENLYVATFPSKTGTVAYTDDLAIALTKDEIDTVTE